MTFHLKTRATLFGVSLAAIALASPAHAKSRTTISPYLEFGQVLVADLKGANDDVLTYSQIAAGINAEVSTQRTQLQVNYRYERRIAWDDSIADDDVHTGLARGAFQVVPDLLTFEAGALAQRARSDIRGDAPGILAGNVDNVTQVYSAYAGPTLATKVGPLNVAAGYRLGYTKAESGDFRAGPGQPALDQYDDSVSHLATASVGMEAGDLPVGWTVSGVYEREEAGQLDQRFEAKGVELDLIAPISPTVALVGSVGYEDIEVTQRAPLVNAQGAPLLDNRGRFVEDPASPRLLAYDSDGVYWDAGVLWRPSRRTAVEARVGRRYGSMTYTGSISYQPSENTQLQVGVYDEVLTFGQQLNDNISRLPTAFSSNGNNPFGQGFGGCVGGANGGQGGCFNPALQSINSSAYRARGITGIYSATQGKLSTSVSAGYAQRKFETPTIGGTFSLDGVTDESWFGSGQVAYQIDEQSAVDAAVFASLFDSGILGAPNVTNFGATTSYNRRFGRKLSATAALGLFSDQVDGFDSDLTATAFLGMRYQF
jgi:hypothetical protein